MTVIVYISRQKRVATIKFIRISRLNWYFSDNRLQHSFLSIFYFSKKLHESQFIRFLVSDFFQLRSFLFSIHYLKILSVTCHLYCSVLCLLRCLFHWCQLFQSHDCIIDRKFLKSIFQIFNNYHTASIPLLVKYWCFNSGNYVFSTC